MANRQVTVLNPAGYQELLQTADTLVVEGDVNMNSNLIGGLPAPVSDNDAARKKYIDDAIANVNLDLQGVTDNGSTTTNSISAAGATFTGDVTVGVDGTGHDVKFFGATAGKYCLWDESSDRLEIEGGLQVNANDTATFKGQTTLEGQVNFTQTSGDQHITTPTNDLVFGQTVGNGIWAPHLKLNYDKFEAYYELDKRLETTDTGAKVTGNLEVTNNIHLGSTDRIYFGDGAGNDWNPGSYEIHENNDLKIISHAGHMRHQLPSGMGVLIENPGVSSIAKFVEGGECELFYDGTKTLETTTDGVTVTGKVVTTGIDNGGQFNIKPGGEFFHFESTGAWHLVYDDSGSGSGWSYAIDATKDYVKLYGPGGSGSTIVLETKTGGVDVTGSLDVSAAITAPAQTSTHTLGGTLEVGGPTGTDNGIIKLRTRPFNITANSSGTGGSAAAGYTTYNTIIQSVSEDLFVNVGANTVFVVRGSISSTQGNQGTEELARFTPGAGVELLYNNSKKLETITTGVEVTGDLTVSGEVTADSFDIASLPVLP